MKQFTIGVDFGTLSGRALLLDARSGKTVASAVMEYPHGVMDRTLPDGTPLPAQSALQHPQDYLDVLSATVHRVMREGGVSPEQIAGIALDFTSCTLIATREDGTPLCFEEKFQSRPQAYVKLWKHHASQNEAIRMTEIAEKRGESWLAIYGGKFSPEWALPKILETLNRDPEVYHETAHFCEAGEWLTSLLCGEEVRAAAFAGFKFCWNERTGYPSEDYLCAVDPRLSGLVGTKLSTHIRTVEKRAGLLCAHGAELTGLLPGTPVALPMLDAEAAMPALGVMAPGVMMLILGTSGVQLVHDERMLEIPGICGAVNSGVVPSLCTYEAGLGGLGDVFDWFVHNCVPEQYAVAARDSGRSIHAYLRGLAEKLAVGESGLIALDWLNGNRSILQDADLSGMILGLHLGTRPEEIYRALIEATAFGMRRTLENYVNHGLLVHEIRASGGIAQKDPMLMQIYADVLGREIRVIDTDQAGALGSAIYAAVAGGLYSNPVEASEHLAVRKATLWTPKAENVAAYEDLYREYCRLYDYFGTGGNDVMKRLRRH